MEIRIVSFGYKAHKQPPARITIDARNLPNPYQVPGLRPRDGLSRPVREWLLDQPGVVEFIDSATWRIEESGASTVAVGCSAGRHRAVVVTEAIAERLRAAGHDVTTEHPAIKRRPQQRRKTTTENGLGWEHQQNRARLITRHRDGTPCWWCDKPMFKDKHRNPDRLPLDADHSIPRAHGGTKADRLLHGSCNRSRGDGTRDHRRPAAPAPTPDTAPLTTRQWW